VQTSYMSKLQASHLQGLREPRRAGARSCTRVRALQLHVRWQVGRQSPLVVLAL